MVYNIPIKAQGDVSMYSSFKNYSIVKHFQDLHFYNTVPCSVCNMTMFLEDTIIDCKAGTYYCHDCAAGRKLASPYEIATAQLDSILSQLEVRHSCYNNVKEQAGEFYLTNTMIEVSANNDGYYYIEHGDVPFTLQEIVANILAWELSEQTY